MKTFYFCFFVSLNLHAQPYLELVAQITQTNYNSQGSKSGGWSFPLTCVVGENEWRIDRRYPPNGKAAWYYDGTNVYSSLQASGSNGRNAGSAGEGGVTITICPSPGGHPLGGLGVNIPWLAFCSGEYLKRPGRTVPLPVLDIHGNVNSLSYTDKTETFADPFGLPTKVELFTSRAQALSSLDDPRLFRSKSLRTALRNRLSNWPEGILSFRYVVHASTNLNGRHFPTEFAYSDFRSTDDGHDWQLVAEGVGKVSSISPTPKPGNVFAQGRDQTILDLRFRHPTKLLDALTYQWTNATVPSTDDPALQAKYAAKAAATPDEIPSEGIKK